MNVFLTSKTSKLAFGNVVFDEMGQPIFTHDRLNGTVQMGPGYSLLDENGDPIGSGGVSEPANQIVYGTGSGVDSSASLYFTGSDGLVIAFNGTNAQTASFTNYANTSGGTGVYIEHETAVASASRWTGIFTNVGFAGSGTLDSLETIRISGNYKSSGTVTDNIGLMIMNQTSGVNNYAIKTGTGAVDFGSEVRAGGDVSGAASRTTFTNATDSTTTNSYVVAGGQAPATENTGWLKIYIGTDVAWVPYWQNATP